MPDDDDDIPDAVQRDLSALELDPEPQEGNIEYKLSLANPTEERIESLCTQLQWRLEEGGGESLYCIGVTDDGKCIGISDEAMDASLATLRGIADKSSATMTVLYRKPGVRGCFAECFLRRELKNDFLDVRVAVVGNVDAGKSTLVGVLTRGLLDNGRGLARSSIFRHAHEVESGRTSSISQCIMGVGASGEVINSVTKNKSHIQDLTWEEICNKSSKVVSFIDLAGHERYFKTTLTGLAGTMPDYVMVTVGANAGVLRMTKEHIAVALALKYPLVFVVTKVDLAPDNILEETLKGIKKILKSKVIGKIPIQVKTEEDIVRCVKNMTTGDQRLVPVIQVSNVSGMNIDLLNLLFKILPPRKATSHDLTQPARFHIDEVFPSVTGVGVVVGGTLLQGRMTIHDQLVIGPDREGKFRKFLSKSMMKKRAFTTELVAGQAGTMALKKTKGKEGNFKPRRGMIVCAQSLNPKAVRTFTAEVVILHHPTTIEVGYQAQMHCLAVRQTVQVLEMDKPLLRRGDRAIVTFKFANPEYLVPGARIVFREGRTKGIGIIRDLYFLDGETSTTAVTQDLLPINPNPNPARAHTHQPAVATTVVA